METWCSFPLTCQRHTHTLLVESESAHASSHAAITQLGHSKQRVEEPPPIGQHSTRHKQNLLSLSVSLQLVFYRLKKLYCHLKNRTMILYSSLSQRGRFSRSPSDSALSPRSPVTYPYALPGGQIQTARILWFIPTGVGDECPHTTRTLDLLTPPGPWISSPSAHY